MAETTLTEADKYALSKMPDGWFTLSDLPYIIRRPRFRCDRLHEKNQLERELVGHWPNCEWRYRKVKGNEHD